MDDKKSNFQKKRKKLLYKNFIFISFSLITFVGSVLPGRRVVSSVSGGGRRPTLATADKEIDTNSAGLSVCGRPTKCAEHERKDEIA